MGMCMYVAREINSTSAFSLSLAIHIELTIDIYRFVRFQTHYR